MSERFDLELRSVQKQFGDQMVVRGVSFALEKGEFLSLLGPSGCGKTTTLSMIAGFEAPSGGAILIRDPRIDALREPSCAPRRPFKPRRSRYTGGSTRCALTLAYVSACRS